MEREQHCRAEALDLERPAELPPDAPRHPLRRQDRERKVDRERGADGQREPAQRCGCAVPFPRPGDEERQQDRGIDLRRDRRPEQRRPEDPAAVQNRADRGEGDRRGVEVEARQHERPEQRRPREEGADGERDATGRRAQCLEREHDQHGGQREREHHQRLERCVESSPASRRRAPPARTERAPRVGTRPRSRGRADRRSPSSRRRSGRRACPRSRARLRGRR